MAFQVLSPFDYSLIFCNRFIQYIYFTFNNLRLEYFYCITQSVMLSITLQSVNKRGYCRESVASVSVYGSVTVFSSYYNVTSCCC